MMVHCVDQSIQMEKKDEGKYNGCYEDGRFAKTFTYIQISQQKQATNIILNNQFKMSQSHYHIILIQMIYYHYIKYIDKQINIYNKNNIHEQKPGQYIIKQNLPYKKNRPNSNNQRMSLYTGRIQDEYEYQSLGGKNGEQGHEYQGYGSNVHEEHGGEENEEQSYEKGFQKKMQDQQDIFLFKKVQLPGIPRSQQIKKFVVSEQTRIVITKSNRVYRWRPRIDPQFKIYQLPEVGKQNFLNLLGGKQKQINIKNAYIDLKGHHCIITSEGNSFYFNVRQSKIRLLTQLQGVSIKALAFSGSDQSKSQSKYELKSGDIIFSSNNVIWMLNLQIVQGELRQKLQPTGVQINSPFQILAIEILKLVQQQNNKYYIVLMSTVSSIHYIIGPNDFNILFARYKDNPENKIKQASFPRGTNSLIKICYSKISNRPTNILWTNGNSFLKYSLPEYDDRITDQFFKTGLALKFAKKNDLAMQKAYQITDNPMNIGITDFHYYILFQECLTIMSLITGNIVHYEDFKGTLVCDMVYEQNTGVFWIYDPKGVIKLDTSKQDLSAWKLLITQKKYKQAYNVCKAKNQNISYSAGLYADDLFEKKQYQKAARLYSQTTRTFEQIFLKYIQIKNNDANDGLIIFLYEWLNKLSSEQKTQRFLIIAWLIQLIIYDLNNLQIQMKGNFEGQKSVQAKTKLKQRGNDLQQLLQNNLDVINQNLVYLIMMSHGRIQNLINFADKKGNIQMIIIHYLSQENYQKALDHLKTFKDPNKVSQVIYKYAHIFFRFQTQKTVDLLVKTIKDFKPLKLMPGLMNIPLDKRVYGVDLLRYCVQQLRSKQKSLHNILIFFYATLPKQKQKQKINKQRSKIDELIQLMKKGRLDFDLDFGSRLFKNYKIHQAQIIVYGKMYLYSKAVSLALQNHKQQLAKQYAQKPDYQDQRKKLWIDIAKYYLHKKQKQQENMNQVILLTKQSKVLKIQDLLPYFHQNIKIQSFKDQICQSLKSYSEEINRLKKMMDSYSTNAQQLKNQLRLIKNRCIEVDSTNKCEQCLKILYNNQFYIFPCMHGFHKQCLFSAVKNQPTFNRRNVQKIATLSQDIREIQSKIIKKRQQQKISNTSSGFSFINPFNILGNKRQEEVQSANMEREEQELKVKKDQIDSILASECIYCGPGIVDTLTMPFDNQVLRDSWKI